MLDDLWLIRVLELRAVQLNSMSQINFTNYKYLMRLDLALNNLTRLESASFENLTRLERLDLTQNDIEHLDERMFKFLGKLTHLHLAGNRISSLGDSLVDYTSLQVFDVAHNQLRTMVTFGVFSAEISLDPKLTTMHLNNNRLERVSYFSYLTSSLTTLYLDWNEIAWIDANAFLNCRLLETLSVSHNNLSWIGASHFFYLFSLTYLNLSFNRVGFVEANSFEHLSKLVELDLSFNRLYAIEDNLFLGLSSLKDLYLYLAADENGNGTIFGEQSFNCLTAVSGLHLDDLSMLNSACVFMLHTERVVQRNVSNGRYLFFKSLNLLTRHATVYDRARCVLTFSLLQFNVHLNLKFDFENELFYAICSPHLVSTANNYANAKRKCSHGHAGDAVLPESRSREEYTRQIAASTSVVLRVISDYFYLITMCALVILFIPVFAVICVRVFVI